MGLAKKQVLIVHADEYALIGLEQALEDCGFSTTTTWDWQEAVWFLATSAFDLIVVGDRPPTLNASDLLAVAGPNKNGANFIVLQGDRSFMAACFDQVCAELTPRCA
jgi:DNA-binding NtrC family response regulator